MILAIKIWSINYQIYEQGTIQRIAVSLHKGGFGKYDKGRYTQ